MEAINELWTNYQRNCTKKQKLLDIYLAYVMFTGISLAVYSLLTGSFPFNSFLASFGSAVGCFVLGGKCDMTSGY